MLCHLELDLRGQGVKTYKVPPAVLFPMDGKGDDIELKDALAIGAELMEASGLSAGDGENDAAKSEASEELENEYGGLDPEDFEFALCKALRDGEFSTAANLLAAGVDPNCCIKDDDGKWLSTLRASVMFARSNRYSPAAQKVHSLLVALNVQDPLEYQKGWNWEKVLKSDRNLTYMHDHIVDASTDSKLGEMLEEMFSVTAPLYPMLAQFLMSIIDDPLLSDSTKLLFQAAAYGMINLAASAIANGADVNALSGTDQPRSSPLLVAFMPKDNLDMLQFLLAAHAEPFYAAKGEYTLFELAEQSLQKRPGAQSTIDMLNAISKLTCDVTDARKREEEKASRPEQTSVYKRTGQFLRDLVVALFHGDFCKAATYLAAYVDPIGSFRGKDQRWWSPLRAAVACIQNGEAEDAEKMLLLMIALNVGDPIEDVHDTRILEQWSLKGSACD